MARQRPLALLCFVALQLCTSSPWRFTFTSSTTDPSQRRPTTARRAAPGAEGTPWEVLDLPPGSDAAAIRRRYRALARTAHPDVARSTERRERGARFAAIGAAYRELMEQVESGESEERFAGRAARPAPSWEKSEERPSEKSATAQSDLESWDERDNDSLVVLFAVFLWLAIFAGLAFLQDSLTWETCARTWEWWCSLKGS
ncbi:unnamed protein product [Durusdinium trenchii]|uniref:J domain-containing protein n=1 Tax=Durusdinium trenchii TaxID=1381693 RepID=A0ABP0NS55_9DINO